MKKIFKFSFVTLLAVMLLAFSAMASDNVVYLADGGSGDGTSASTPVGSLSAAYTALGDNGGTIVISGKYTVGNTVVVNLPAHTGEVKITSLHDGVDYRTSGAAFHMNGTSFASFNGPTAFDDINFTFGGSAAGIYMNFNDLYIGHGVETLKNGTSGYYLYVVGGANNKTGAPPLAAGETFNMEIYSGKYHTMTPFSRSIKNTSHFGTATVTLGGDADVSGFYGGPTLSPGASGGTTIVNMENDASITTFYLGGNNCAAMNGDITVNMGDNAKVAKITNYNATFFTNTKRILNYTSTVSLPSDYETCFDTITQTDLVVGDLNTVYVADGASGDGANATAPIGSLANAFAMLSENGGTIVLVGDTTVANAVSLPECADDVTFRAENGAKLILSGSIALAQNTNGKAVIFDLPITADGGAIYGGFRNVTFDENCTVSGSLDFFGGTLSSSEDDANNNTVITTLPYTITVKNGTFRNFEGGICRAVYTDMVGSVAAPLTVDISGGNFTDSFNLSGGAILADDVNLTISGGSFACPIYVRSVSLSTQARATKLSPVVASDRTYYAMDGDVTINISGGNFTGELISAFNANVAYTQLLRGNFTVNITGGTFSEGTVLDATQVKAYEGVTDKFATVTYPDSYDFTCVRFDKVNNAAMTYTEPLRVAFVGDSITEGVASTEPLTNSYPAVFEALAKTAGKDVIVANYGVSASGLLEVTSVYYPDRIAYSLLIEETDADYIVVGLGTNDHLASSRGGLRAAYIENYTEFIETLAALPDTEKIFMTSAILSGTKAIPGASQLRIRSVIAPLQKQIATNFAKADAGKYIFVDLFGLTLPCAKEGALLSGDRVHPKNSGYIAMANAMYDAIFEGKTVPAPDYHRTEIYLSENGTEFGSGTKDDPTSRIDIAFAMIDAGANATVYIDGTISHAAAIVTPVGAEKITLVGVGENASLEMLEDGNTIWINSDIKFDNITFKGASAESIIMGNYHNVEFTDTTALDGVWSFYAGLCSYNAAGAVIPYDTEATTSSANDCTVILNGTGSFKNFALGNYRVATVAPIGTYSGNLNATVGDGYSVSGTIVGAVGQNYLTGSVTASLPYGFTCADYASVGNVASPILYDASNNTGTVTVTNREAASYSDVVFVADGGNGDGTKPSSPLGNLADAYAKLANGGTIVVCGKYTMGNTVTNTMPAHTEDITITSVFAGVDYRTSGAMLSFNGTNFVKFAGPTIFDAVTMSLDKTSAGICMNFNPITVTDSVKVVQSAGGTSYYMYLIIGTNGDKVATLEKDEILEVTINGGKFITVTAFTRSVQTTNTGTVIMNIGGNADIRDLNAGSLTANSYAGSSVVNLSGNAKVTTFFLGGNGNGGMKGDVVVNVADEASVGAIKGATDALFPLGERYINFYSNTATFPSGYAGNFDAVTTYADNANVKFVKSGANGNGMSPFSPIGSIEEAYALLPNGGTVVVTDSVNFANTSTLQLASHTGTVKLTSLYGGMDYRTLGNAKVGFNGTKFVYFNGDSVIDDLTLSIDKTSEGFCFNFHNAHVGKGFKIEESMSAYHMLIVGGFNDMNYPALAADKEVTLTIEGGRYHTVTGFTRNNTNMSHEGTVTVNIGGDALINAYCVGPISAGSKGGNAIANMYDNAVVNNMYLGGYNCGAMNGDVTVSIDGTATIGKFLNYNETFFPSSEKSLDILSVETSLPSNYKEVFDNITTVQSTPIATLTLPEDAPAFDKLSAVLIDGKSGSFTVEEKDGVITVEFESVSNEITVSLTYKDTSYRRIEYAVTITNGIANATLKSDKVYDGSVMYIADGASGDGLTAESPLATLEAAYTNMLTDGGTIVVCGNLTMAKYIARAHADAITITSVYDGVDYRESGAKLYYPASSTLVLGGKTIFRDITFDFVANGLISAAYNPVVFDTGITVNYDKENDEAGLYLVGGYNTGVIPENPDYTKSSDITIRSGTIGRVFGFSRYVGDVSQSGTANITLERDAHVRYLIAGATGNSATSKDAFIKIRENAIVETLYLGGLQKDNYMLGETIVDITEITGGDIYEFDGISLYAMVNGTDTIHYDPRTVPDGVLHLASLAWVDNILTLCDVAGKHTFGTPFASPFDENTEIHTCEKCGFTTSLEEIGGSVNGVVYVADGGFGNGSSPAAPLGSYADAFDALGGNGGIIVVIRETTIEKTERYKHGSDPEFYQEPMHTGHVLVTSVYGGVDYREFGAKLVFDGLMDYKLSGPVTFDDINFDTTNPSAENTIAARYYPLTFGDGVKMLKTFENDGYKLNIYGGYKYFRYTDFAGVEIEDELLRFLNHSVSTDNVEIPDATNLNIGNTVARKDAANAFNAMWAEMESKGMQLPIVSSAYQTYEWKHDFFANFLGNTRASHPDWDYERAYIYVTKSCGEPGASEHHLGVAVDMYDSTIESDNPNHDYDTTAEWDWLVNQGGAQKHGIILRYPENSYCTSVTGFINEAWHFRYVGVEHANAYIESGYPIFEFYVGDVIGLFAKDSSVTVNGGSFYNISGGSTECTDITFTGTNKVYIGADAEYENVEDVVAANGDATGDGIVNLMDVVRIIKAITNDSVTVHQNADINNDGSINVFDALIILKSIVNG